MRLVLALFLVAACGVFAGENTRPIIPPFKRWSEVPVHELKPSTPPSVERVAFPNGLVVFLIEDRELPLIEFSLMLRSGEVHDPAAMTGLTSAGLNVIRTGGSEKWPGDKLDTALEEMAAVLNVVPGVDFCTISLNALKEDFPKSLDILADILKNPAFPEEKLQLHLTQAKTQIAKRNDAPMQIIGREFRKALYGTDSPYARVMEYSTLAKIDRAALQAFHKENIHPSRFILGIAGDFKKDEMVAKLTAAFGEWPYTVTPAPKAPALETDVPAKTLFAERAKLNQTTIMMGHFVTVRRDSPDFPAIQMMNEVLSGGMSARMFTEVRTKKGLAYSVFGGAQPSYNRPGVFYASVLTRNEQAVDAADAVRFEIERMRNQGVTAEELSQARESILNSFVFNFDTTQKILTRHMTYELYGYPQNYTDTLLQALKTVTVQDVSRAAKTYLQPDKMVLIGVGSSEGVDPAKSFKNVKNAGRIDLAIPAAP